MTIGNKEKKSSELKQFFRMQSNAKESCFSIIFLNGYLGINNLLSTIYT